jgi:hypothetical protein
VSLIQKSQSVPFALKGNTSKFIFPWVVEDEVASQVFNLFCEETTEKVEEQLRRRIN